MSRKYRLNIDFASFVIHLSLTHFKVILLIFGVE